MSGPSSDRRSFLRQLVTFTAAAPVAVIPGIALAAAPAENPVLIELGGRLDQAENAYRRAAEERAAALAEYERLLPPVPDDLIVERFSDEARIFNTELERDYDGNLVGESGHWRSFASRSCLEHLVAEFDGRSRVGRLARKRLKLAHQREAEQEALARLTGLDRADGARGQAETELNNVVKLIQEEEAKTLVGIVIKARAMIAIATTRKHGFDPGAWWGRAFAENVISVGRG